MGKEAIARGRKKRLRASEGGDPCGIGETARASVMFSIEFSRYRKLETLA